MNGTNFGASEYKDLMTRINKTWRVTSHERRNQVKVKSLNNVGRDR